MGSPSLPFTLLRTKKKSKKHSFQSNASITNEKLRDVYETCQVLECTFICLSLCFSDVTRNKTFASESF